MRFLLLDDNLMSSHRLSGALERLGHTCKVATAPGELADTDRVVINLGSRGIDGLALLKQVKQSRPDLPVIGFCGHLETERRQAAKAAGVDRLLTQSALAERPEELCR